MLYLLSLRNKKSQKRLGFSAYNSKRAALYHLYRMYGRKQSIKFVSELSIMMRGLKRKLAIEKQNGRGHIQTGKSPITYSMYKRINNLL